MRFFSCAAVILPRGHASADLAERSRAATRAMQEGRFDEAARMYRDLLQALPNEAGLLMNLGMALAMGGHEREALAPLERALDAQPRPRAGAYVPRLQLPRARAA